MVPGELQKSEWFKIVNGKVIRPTNVTYTCTKPTFRMLDFGVVTHDADLLITQMKGDDCGPWTAHYGLVIVLSGKPQLAQERTMRMPKVFVHPRGVQRKPGPPRKQSRKKGARAQQAPLRTEVSTSCPEMFVPRRRATGKGPFPLHYLLSDPDFEDFESTASGEPSKPGEDSSGPDMDDEGVVRPPRRAKSHFQQLANEQRREQSRFQQVSSSWSKDERTSCGVLFTQIRW